MSSSEKLTRKGAHSRERFLNAAITLFLERGYEHVTMRDIAAATNTSLGSTYHYFASKEEIVLAFYERLAADLAAEVQALPSLPLAARFERMMQLMLIRLTPYRLLLGVIAGAALLPHSRLAVLGDSTLPIQRQVGQTFRSLVTGAADVPNTALVNDLTTVLYVGHLLFLLFWLHDRSPQARATHELLTLSCSLLALGRRLLRFPPIAKSFSRFAQIVGDAIGPNR
jgi:AcrR family transcriptional regulator